MKKSAILAVFLIVAVAIGTAVYFIPTGDNETGSASKSEDFGIERTTSSVDYNGNGTDDYTDILIGARKDAEAMPKYDGSYVAGGYPPDNIGVCTDLVWRAFKEAGYSLKDMLDDDIAAYPDDYPNASPADPNIDFRRVKNLRVFFDKYAQKLTCDVNDIAAFQAGDIVVFGDDKHIGVVSDKRDSDGRAFVLHNANQKKREQKYLDKHTPTAHYRFDASKIPQEILRPWHDD